MKKETVILSIFLSLIPFASALSLNMKSSYDQGETLIASIEGNFISPLSSSNLFFYSGNNEVAMISDIAKVNDKYWIYAQIPFRERNYTLVLKDAHYMEAGKENIGNIRQDFSVSSSIVPFSVNPGFIITNTKFSVRVDNHGTLLPLTFSFQGSTQTKEISSGSYSRIYFDVQPSSGIAISEILFSGNGKEYKIPVAVYSEDTIPDNPDIPIPVVNECELNSFSCFYFCNSSQEQKFFNCSAQKVCCGNKDQLPVIKTECELNKFSCKEVCNSTEKSAGFACQDSKLCCAPQSQTVPKKPIILSKSMKFLEGNMNLTIQVLKRSKTTFPVSLSNTGQAKIYDIKFNISSFEGYLVVTPQQIDLEAGDTKQVNVSIYSTDKNLTLSRNLVAYTKNLSAIVPITIITTTNVSAVINQPIGGNDPPTVETECEDINANECQAGEICPVASIFTPDGKICCPGTCSTAENNQPKRNYFWIVLIIIVILGIVFFMFKKMKLKKESPDEMIKNRAEEFQSRFKSREIRGGLSTS